MLIYCSCGRKHKHRRNPARIHKCKCGTTWHYSTATHSVYSVTTTKADYLDLSMFVPTIMPNMPTISWWLQSFRTNAPRR